MGRVPMYSPLPLNQGKEQRVFTPTSLQYGGNRLFFIPFLFSIGATERKTSSLPSFQGQKPLLSTTLLAQLGRGRVPRLSQEQYSSLRAEAGSSRRELAKQTEHKPQKVHCPFLTLKAQYLKLEETHAPIPNYQPPFYIMRSGGRQG